MQTLLQDLRFGARMLMKSPAVTIVGIIALTLGIGANTAIFSVVHAVLLRSFPYQDGDKLAIVWEHRKSGKDNLQNVINLGKFAISNSKSAMPYKTRRSNAPRRIYLKLLLMQGCKATLISACSIRIRQTVVNPARFSEDWQSARFVHQTECLQKPAFRCFLFHA